MKEHWKHWACTQYPAHCSSCMSALTSQPCNMKSSTSFSSSVWLFFFYLLQNLPVTQFFIHHLKYRVGWDYTNYTNYILRLYISTHAARKANTENDREAWHVALLSHFLLEADANRQCTKFPLVYWFVLFLRRVPTKCSPHIHPDPTVGHVACWNTTFPKILLLKHTSLRCHRCWVYR